MNTQIKNKEEKPLVAIHCMVYNHAPFLRECFEGFVMQQTTFPFVAIVHDDASTDNSADIIREYEAKYPHIFKPIYQTVNQYSIPGVSVMRIIDNAIKQSGAKYIAMCEGDDYWTDPMKLQRQVDFLEKHPDYSLSAENATRIYINDTKTQLFSKLPSRDVTIDEMIQTRQFATASVVYRKSAAILPKDTKLYDTLLWCILAQQGKVHYNSINSSVYRLGTGVTQKDKIAWAYQVFKLNKALYSTIHITRKNKILHNAELIVDLLVGISTAIKRRQYKDAITLTHYCIQLGILPYIMLLYNRTKRLL